MPIGKPNRSQLTLSILLLTALLIGGLIVWGFWQQFALAKQLRLEEKKLESQVAAARKRNEELASELTYVQSDEYVERWARENLRMAKPGEVVVVPLWAEMEEDAPAQETPPPEPSKSKSAWQEIWSFIAGGE